MIKSFLLKVLLFVLIYLGLVQVARNAVSSYYANDYFKVKYEYYQQHQADINTVFIGSSRTFRHVVPQVYDSILSEFHTSTFNLGSPHTFNPETYYLLEHFLEAAHDSVKYVIIDLQPLSKIFKRNVNAPSNYYWHNLRYWKFAMEYIQASRYPQKRKIELAAGYTSSLIMKYIQLPDYKTLKGRPDELTKYWLGFDKRGNLSLDDHMQIDKDETSFMARRNEFLADTTVIAPRIQGAINDFTTNNHSSSLNEVHLRKIKSLIRKADSHGIQLLFLISPLWEDFKEQLAIKENLPDENVIEIADYHKYPDLYNTSILFDAGHYNAKGSRLFTTYLAREMKNKMKPSKFSAFRKN